MVPSTHLFCEKKSTTILRNDVVSITVYVVDRVFSLGTYITDRVLGHV